MSNIQTKPSPLRLCSFVNFHHIKTLRDPFLMETGWKTQLDEISVEQPLYILPFPHTHKRLNSFTSSGCDTTGSGLISQRSLQSALSQLNVFNTKAVRWCAAPTLQNTVGNDNWLLATFDLSVPSCSVTAYSGYVTKYLITLSEVRKPFAL